MRGVNLRIHPALFTVFQRDNFLRLAEINAARQFADDHNIETFDNLMLERRGCRQSRIANGRTQIGKHFQIFAQTQQACFRTLVVRHAVPLRTAHSPKQHRIRLMGELHSIIANGFFMRIIGRTADKVGFGFKACHAGLGHEIEDFFDLAHHLDADSVTRQQQKIEGCHDANSSWSDH